MSTQTKTWTINFDVAVTNKKENLEYFELYTILLNMCYFIRAVPSKSAS